MAEQEDHADQEHFELEKFYPISENSNNLYRKGYKPVNYRDVMANKIPQNEEQNGQE